MMMNYKSAWWLPLAATSLTLLIAACSAANTATEEAGFSQSAVGEAETGFRCSAANIAMPADLPDVEACINDEAGGTGPATGCRGWTKSGPYMTTSDELRSAERFGAQLYMIEPDASTLCLYLYRGDRTTSQGSLNGVHCYNKTTCDVCWWDASTARNTKPTAAALRHFAADGSDCSDCHRNGPLLPKYTLWEAASDTTKALHQVCAAAGGATWAQAPIAWPRRAPVARSVVAAPQGCAGRSCHQNGFASEGSYCQFIKHAFADDKGSMRGNGEKFRTKTGCENFRTAMGCAAADLDCDSEDVASPDPAPAAPAAPAGGEEGGGGETPPAEETPPSDDTPPDDE